MMDKRKTKAQLISELEELRKRIASQEASKVEHRQSEERYRLLVETIPHGVQEIDTSGTITFVNSAHCNIHGYEEVELIGKSALDLVASESEREELSKYLAALVKEQPKPMPYVGQDRTKDGRIKDIQVDWAYKKDNHGRVIGFVSILTDITERKRVEDELHKAHDEMEQKVKERTSELMETNEQLRREIENRKRVEERLRESEAHIRGILNAAPVGIGLVRERELDWISHRMCEMLGYSDDELGGQSARIAYESDEEFERVGRVKYAEIQERGVGAVETRFKRKDGSVLDVLLCSSAVDPSDLSKGAIFTVLDITERKQAENVLKESEQRFRAVLEAVPDLMLVLDSEGTYREVFTAKPELLYAPADQVIGKKIHDVLPPENAKQIQKVIDRVLATGELQIYEYGLDTGGMKRWFAARIIEFKFQNSDCVLWCARDITQRNLAEEALRDSEERHRILLEAAPDPIAVYDMEGKATYINPAFEEAFGWPSQELLGKRIEYVPEENWPETRIAITRMLRGEKIYSFETRRLTKDGRILDIQLSSSVFHDRDDNPAGNIVILRDVTKRNMAEDALRKSEAALAEQSRHLEEVNAALKALLRQRENDKADLEQRLISNFKELVMPYVEKLKNSRLHSDQMTLVGILESNMKEIVSPFVTKLSSRFLNLTPTEIQVAGLIKDGKTSKEIAALLNASENTVRSHRFHIRSKLGIKNKKVNLRSYLQSIQD
jgi:PAS domain S-box-containing protein